MKKILWRTTKLFVTSFKRSWYHRQNPEDQINRKPDGQKNHQSTAKAKNVRPNSTVLNLIFGPIYIILYICLLNHDLLGKLFGHHSCWKWVCRSAVFNGVSTLCLPSFGLMLFDRKQTSEIKSLTLDVSTFFGN